MLQESPARSHDPAEPSLEDDQQVLDRVRHLLVGLDPTELDSLRQTVEDPLAFRRHLAQHLAGALGDLPDDREFTEAAFGLLHEKLWDEIEENPDRLGEVVGPALGPAIAKAVRLTVDGFIERVDQVVQTGLSPRALGWRIEAWRTGTPFADIVIRKTMRSKVEQVLIIHRETGLLLQSIGEADADPSLVSGMLTALRDFAADAFDTQESDGLDRMRVGDFTLWIEDGKHAVIAAALRGEPQVALREAMRSALAAFETQHRAALVNFDGDTAPFESAFPAATALLGVHGAVKDTEHRGTRRMVAAVLVLLTALIVIAAFFNHRAKARFLAAAERLAATPGIVVTAADWDRRTIEGLRDPSALEPRTLLGDAEEGDEPKLSFSPYFSLEPELLLRRAKRVLAPPATIELSWADEKTLRVRGTADAEFGRRLSEETAALFAGLGDPVTLDRSELVIAEERDLADAVAALPSLSIGFVFGTLEPLTEHNLDALDRSLSRIQELARGIYGRPGALRAIGLAAWEVQDLDQPLSAERFEWIRSRVDTQLPEAIFEIREDGLPPSAIACTTDCEPTPGILFEWHPPPSEPQ